MKIKMVFGNKAVPYKVISIGNLSVGGTGKSVVTTFLVKRLSGQGAVFLRGYKRQGRDSIVVHDNNQNIAATGDEALMLAEKLNVPVVVGKNRKTSARLLEQFCTQKKITINYVVLDDAYQNFQLKKDFEILLLDARKPFENGHCLPAGRLRETDYARADAIILTHAKKMHNMPDLPEAAPIFKGHHRVVGVRSAQTLQQVDVTNKRMFVVAGIGSFSGFVASVKSCRVKIAGYCEYPDHHAYTKKDIDNMIDKINRLACDGIITTEKDWQKIKQHPLHEQHKFFILEVEFAFLSQQEDDDFFRLIGKKLTKRPFHGASN